MGNVKRNTDGALGNLKRTTACAFVVSGDVAVWTGPGGPADAASIDFPELEVARLGAVGVAGAGRISAVRLSVKTPDMAEPLVITERQARALAVAIRGALGDLTKVELDTILVAS